MCNVVVIRGGLGRFDPASDHHQALSIRGRRTTPKLGGAVAMLCCPMFLMASPVGDAGLDYLGLQMVGC